MKIAIIGSHGTGKTTTIDYLKKQYGSKFQYYDDMFRVIAKANGYQRPREVVMENGITPFVTAALSCYCTLNNSSNAILDQGPVVVMGYYYAHLEKAELKPDISIEEHARALSNQIDAYLYIPTGRIPLIADDMRPSELDFQILVDRKILHAIDVLGIDHKKVHEIKSIAIDDRVKEAIAKIEGIMENAQ